MMCTFTPDASQPEIYYDLRLADEALTGNLRVAVKNQAGAITGDIYTRICRPPTVTCGQGSYACDSASPPCISNPAAIDVYQNGAKCVAPGHLSNHVWSLQNPNDIKGGAQITFSGGDPARGGSGGLQRQYVMQLECDWSVNYPQAVSGTESTSASVITYTVVVRTSGACVLQPLPLSAGWISIILMGVSCFVYFVGGSVYNYKVRGEEGLKIIPQWAYWKQLPGHVYEGCIFSYKHGSRALKNAPRDIQDWYKGRNTKELREPIAYTPAAE